MNFLKNGSLSYELVGKFLESLPKEVKLDISDELKKVKSAVSVIEITPALEFFDEWGHCDFNLKEKKLLVHSERKKT